MIELPRSSGVQLHLTSLPGGRLGPEAYRFVDWLAAAGQTWWQMLPLGPPDRYGSPYKSRSAFAAWPGFLADRRAPVSASSVSAFREREAYLGGRLGALFGSGRFGGPGAVRARMGRAAGVRGFEWGSAVWGRGDLRGAGSADHRAHPDLFRSGVVAGAPPDAFSDDGQLWGNPVYDWPAMRRRRLPLVGRAGAPHPVAFRSRPTRPLPRVRVLLGRARRGAHRGIGTVAARPGPGPVRRARARARAASRWSRRTSA